MEKLLTAWLPLWAVVLLFLYLAAMLLGRNPRSERGELPIFEKLVKYKFATVMTVAAVLSGILGLLALSFFLLRLVEFKQWMLYAAYVVIAVAGLFFVGSFVYMISRLFEANWARWVSAITVVVVSGLWALWPNWLTVDLLAAILILGGLSSFLQLTLNFRIVALVNVGLVVYDIINVYLTGNMMRVAQPMMDLRLPGMIVVPSGWALDSPPAAALGAGDIVFPGLMIALAGVLAYRSGNKMPLYGGIIGYGTGMLLIFGILYLAKVAQPALITLSPCVLVGILLGARRAGLVQELLAMRHPKPVHPKHVHGRNCSCSC